MPKYSTGKNPTDTDPDDTQSETYEPVSDDDALQTAVETALTPHTASVGVTHSSITITDFTLNAETDDDLVTALATVFDDIVNAVENTTTGVFPPLSIKIFIDAQTLDASDVTPTRHTIDKGEPYTPSTLEIPLNQLSADPVMQAVESTDAVARAYSAFITNPESRIRDTTLSDYTPRFHIAILTEHAAGHPDNN